MNNINYQNIADSIKFYSSLGYTYIELPWYVTADIMDITRPPHVGRDMDYYIPKNDKVLVASGEQSFLYLIVKGLLPPGKYQGVTPCYRFEPINQLHRKTFVKNELIVFGESGIGPPQVKDVMNDAKLFFNGKLNERVEIMKFPQENSIINYDLVYKGEELGSYGFRNHRNINWIYGTGCAEPRLSAIQSIDYGRVR